MDLQTYAITKKAIEKLSGPEINKAVTEYLEKNPTVLLDNMGIGVVDGYLCVNTGLSNETTVSESDAEK